MVRIFYSNTQATKMPSHLPQREASADASNKSLAIATVLWYRSAMNAKQRRTLEAIFARPVPSDLRWADIESLLVALGAERSEGRGSRVRFLLNGAEAVFHRPHPSPNTDKGAVAAARRFLETAGVKP